VIVEWRAWKGSEVWQRMGRFFAGLLALNFAVGVATGIVMEFQFGTNWASYSKFVGDIFGAPLAAEALFAFFLESTFLGLYLFGRGRISKGATWFSILMVAVGATISAFWIIVANSWQQTPAGHVVQNGRAELTDFAAAVFNPSTLIRFFHTVDGALITGAFVMAGISAWLILKKRGEDVARPALALSLGFGFVVSILALFPTGHLSAGQVAELQPEKFAAIEGLYTGADDGAPLVVFAYPTDKPPELKAKIEMPGILSWLAFGDANHPVKGISDFPPEDVPHGAELWLSFVSFHNMVALGSFFIFATGLGLFFLWRKTLFDKSWFLWMLVFAIPLPVLACEFGWTAAEVGRQPWIVYHLLRTKDAASATVTSGEILFSIGLFGVIYLLLGILWFFLMVKRVKTGPEAAAEEAV